MATAITFEGQITVPMDLRSLADFRCWAMSDQFPERGRIDYIAGTIEVDMSPEGLMRHGRLKGKIYATLLDLVDRQDLGYLWVDRARVCSAEAGLSAEPDAVFVSHESLSEGRVRMVPKSGGDPEEFIELDGAPDLIVEIVSDSSVTKDTKRLPAAYFRAGVPEFWLADARREPFVFQIHRRGESGFEAVEADADGFQPSAVFGCRFRLQWRRDRSGHWAFDLEQSRMEGPQTE